MGKEENISNEQVKSVESGLSKRIISEYEGVKTIKFNSWGHSEKTGMWYVVAKINDTEEIEFSLSDISTKSVRSEVTDSGFSLKERSSKISTDSISLKDYDIVYSTN